MTLEEMKAHAHHIYTSPKIGDIEKDVDVMVVDDDATYDTEEETYQNDLGEALDLIDKCIKQFHEILSRDQYWHILTKAHSDAISVLTNDLIDFVDQWPPSEPETSDMSGGG